MVQAVLAAFPGAEIRTVRPADEGAGAAAEAGAPAPPPDEDEMTDDWDPFDPFEEES